jgi:hypothetical protein
VDVAVHEGVGQAAGCEVGPPAVEPVEQPGQALPDHRVEGRRVAAHHVLDRDGQCRPAPVGQAEREQLVLLPDLPDLQADQQRDEGVQHREVGAVLVLAGDVGHQHPSRLGGEQRRHRAARQPVEHRALVGEERGDALEPRGAVLQREPPHARQVPGADLLRSSGQPPPRLLAGGRWPRRGRGPGPPGSAYGSRSGEGRQLAVPRRQRQARAVGDLGEHGDRAARLCGQAGVEQAQDRDLRAVALGERLRRRSRPPATRPPRR